MRTKNSVLLLWVCAAWITMALPAFADNNKECVSCDVAPGPSQASIEAMQASLLAVFKLKKFKCDLPSPKSGLTCIGRIKGYPRDVVIVVPPGYQPRERADLVLHLHGHNYTKYSATDLNRHFGLATGMVESGRDAILIAPHSYGNCTDFERRLVDKPERFKNFIGESMALLKEANLTEKDEPASITLTAHSGAYRSIGKILRSGVYASKIKEIYAFDATYGLAEQFADFAAKPGNRFWSAQADAKVVAVAEDIQGQLKNRKVPYFTGSMLKSVTPEVLKVQRLGFVRSGGDHDQTFSKYFPVFLSYRP